MLKIGLKLPEFFTEDGRYLFVEQEDGNAVVYDTISGRYIPVFDRWSYEASIRNQIPTAPTNPIPSEPSGSSGSPVLIAKNVNPIGMSYWNNINNHRGSSELKLVLAVDDGLIIYTISKDDLRVLITEPINVHHTGEGVYFSAQYPSMLYIPQGNTLWRYNIETKQREAAWIVGQNNLWQCHTSVDDKVHSATIRNSNYQNICWGAYSTDREWLIDFKGHPDECQIDKSGQWLICKENDDNRIIHLRSGGEKFISNADGAVGHSDVGHGYMVGENDQIGAAVYWSLESLTMELVYGPNIWNMGYVSVQNDRCLLSLPDSQLILVQGGVSRLVCLAPTDSQDYADRVKANLCPLGEFAVWTARVNGELNAYIVRV